MKGFLLSFLLFFVISGVSANCATTKSTILYANPEKFFILDRFNTEDKIQQFFMDDIINGDAIVLCCDVSVTLLNRVSDNISLVLWNDLPYICLTSHLVCN